MSDEVRPAQSAGICPTCRQPGRRVQTQTVKAQLALSLRYVTGTIYHFCESQSCPVVYFTSDGLLTHMVTDLRERVYQKEPDRDDCLSATASAIAWVRYVRQVP